MVGGVELHHAALKVFRLGDGAALIALIVNPVAEHPGFVLRAAAAILYRRRPRRAERFNRISLLLLLLLQMLRRRCCCCCCLRLLLLRLLLLLRVFRRRLLLLVDLFLAMPVRHAELVEADQVAFQVQLGLEWLVTEGACDTLRVVDQAHVLAQVRQVTVHAVADRTGARVQRVQFA